MQSEPLGWDNQVGPMLDPVASIFLEPDAADGLVDNQQLALSLLFASSYDNYNITAPETITVRLNGPPVLSTASLQ
eukprot:4690933-Prymnesium_polylepis.1